MEKHIYFELILCILIGSIIGLIVILTTYRSNLKTISSLESTVIQRTCAGKVIGTYENCSNIKDVEGFVKFDIADPNVDSIMIRGGIIKVEINKKGEK